MTNPKLDLPSIGATTEAARAFVAQLDKQIEEAHEFLAMAQALRRATAAAIGIDRGEGDSTMSKLLKGANRRHYEGEDPQHQAEGSGE